MDIKFIPETRNDFEMDQNESYMVCTVDTGWRTKCVTICFVCYVSRIPYEYRYASLNDGDTFREMHR
jgi:hypothetical protein